MSARLDRADHAASPLRSRFDRQRTAYASDPMPARAIRLDRLARLAALTDAIEDEMAQAIALDFGHRPIQVTRLADGMVVRSAIALARRNLAGWMKARRIATPLAYLPATSSVRSQPLGVVGIVGPWNYPYQLTMGPAVSALAAGNRVMIKPSERTPRFSALLARAVAERFDADELTVTTGDADVARDFVALPFDHLLFTGSTAVGREVARAAAANLTPVTLELGGKSPAILNADCDLDEAAPRIMAAKLFNSGQTCIAPDYLLVHERLLDRLGAALGRATRTLYPTIADNPDYASLIDARHVARLEDLLDDARGRGARVMPLHDETETLNRKLPPFALFDVHDAMAIQREEIFGPLLPIVVYRRIDEAIDYVNARERPLALYWFGRDRADRDAVLARTVSGGVTINDCLFHVAHEMLPFGGVGASGHGRYHGEHGFRTFSHDKPVFHQSRWTGTGMTQPPYGVGFERLMRWIRAIG